jgi:hypothetical protein
MSTNIPFTDPYSIDYQIAIARGIVPGAEVFGAYGRRTTVGAETNILWPDGTYALPPAAGLQISVKSDSINDTAAGTGIRTVDVHYLDDSLVRQIETVSMNGTTDVLTVATNIRFIECMHMRTYGSGKVAAGTILAHVGAQNYSEISVGKVRCSSSVRMVPAGKKLFVSSVYAGSSSGTAAATTVIEMVSCHFDGHDYTADSIFFPLGAASFQDGSGGLSIHSPIVLGEGATFGLRFETDKAATITGFWNGWIEDA